MTRFALVDCNNFYASCERVFDPSLHGRPVIVQSNNDGCVIARSAEPKSLGIKMGQPVFQRRNQIRQHHIAVFSSNYALYGDMSARVMDTLAGFAPEIEVYSIDFTGHCYRANRWAGYSSHLWSVSPFCPSFRYREILPTILRRQRMANRRFAVHGIRNIRVGMVLGGTALQIFRAGLLGGTRP